jgi:aspartokinase
MVALEKAEISVLQTSDSDYSLSVLVPEADTMRTVRTLQEKFELSKIE